MSAYFDTSVLVAAVSDQLPQHNAALACFQSQTRDGANAATSTHALAETYATLTALPLQRRISGTEALRLIEFNFLARLRILDLPAGDYHDALRLCGSLGRVSGQIYDALHVIAAKKAGCDVVYTYNHRHFASLAAGAVVVSTP